MNNNVSLKKKSILALACYVCFLITVIGSMTYSVFKESDDIIISGGIWPEPNTLELSK